MAISSFVGVVLLALSVSVGVYGWRQAGRHDVVTETPTTEVRQIRETGLVELEGQVRVGETFESPIQRRECVLAAWEVEEWHESGKHSDWVTIATGIYAESFELDDGTDRVRVEIGDHSDAGGSGLLPDVDDWLGGTGVAVDDVLCEFRRVPKVAQHPPNDVPAHVRAFVAREPRVDASSSALFDALDFGTQHGERRYSEQVVEPGQDVYVLGHAHPDADATRPLHPEDVTVGPPSDGDGELIVSDLPEEDLKGRFRSRRLLLPGAILLAVVGAVLLFGLPGWMVAG